ncbi:hypothetical protein ABVT39_010365 [Epinephelus coioides]
MTRACSGTRWRTPPGLSPNVGIIRISQSGNELLGTAEGMAACGLDEVGMVEEVGMADEEVGMAEEAAAVEERKNRVVQAPGDEGEQRTPRNPHRRTRHVSFGDMQQVSSPRSLAVEQDWLGRFMNVTWCHRSVNPWQKLNTLIQFQGVLSVQAPESGDDSQKSAHDFLTTVMDQMRSLSPLLREVAASVGGSYRCPVEKHLMFEMQTTRTCQRHYISDSVHPDAELDHPTDCWVTYNKFEVTHTTIGIPCASSVSVPTTFFSTKDRQGDTVTSWL